MQQLDDISSGNNYVQIFAGSWEYGEIFELIKIT